MGHAGGTVQPPRAHRGASRRPIIVTDNHPLFPTGAETFTWTIIDPLGTEWDLYGMRTSFTFLEPGIYTVTAEVADAWSNEGSDTINVTVQDRTPPGAVSDLIVKDDGPRIEAHAALRSFRSLP